jgi:PHD/YefM family antitoxin component YafN of YafNO toxin-antitoxin module
MVALDDYESLRETAYLLKSLEEPAGCWAPSTG